MDKKFIALAGVLYLIMLGLYIQFSFDFYKETTILFASVFLVGTFSGFIFSKKAKPKIRIRITPFIYTVSILSCLVLISGFTVMTAQNFITLHRAEKLISNINHYQKASGHLPETLNELQPKYMSSIPRVAGGLNGRPFEYANGFKLNENPGYDENTAFTNPGKDDFYIKFKTYFGGTYYYNSKTKKWKTFLQKEDSEKEDHGLAFLGFF